MPRGYVASLFLLTCVLAVSAEPPQPTLQPLLRTIDLNLGESQEVELADGQKAHVKLLDLHEARDGLRSAIRRAEVQVEVNGQKVSLVAGNYRLPVRVAGGQIDCAATRGYHQNSSPNEQNEDPWGLDADGQTTTGARVEHTYAKPGVYSEVLKITDAAGQSDYDFGVVQILDPKHPERLPPSIHAAYYPTFGTQPGDPVIFLVRTFGTTDGKETWDFGDGSSPESVQSDGNVNKLAPNGYARTMHRYARPGQYLVRVARTNRFGDSAIAHLQVRVGLDAPKE